MPHTGPKKRRLVLTPLELLGNACPAQFNYMKKCLQLATSEYTVIGRPLMQSEEQMRLDDESAGRKCVGDKE